MPDVELRGPGSPAFVGGGEHGGHGLLRSRGQSTPRLASLYVATLQTPLSQERGVLVRPSPGGTQGAPRGSSHPPMSLPAPSTVLKLKQADPLNPPPPPELGLQRLRPHAVKPQVPYRGDSQALFPGPRPPSPARPLHTPAPAARGSVPQCPQVDCPGHQDGREGGG